MADSTLKPFSGELDKHTDGPWSAYGAPSPGADGPWSQYAGLQPFSGQLDGKPAEPGLIPTIKRTGGQMLTTAATAAEDLTGPNAVTRAVHEAGQGIIDKNPAGVTKLGDVLEKPWLAVKEAVGQFGPQIGAAAAGGFAGARAGAALGGIAGPAGGAAGATIGGVIGGLLPIFTQEYGGIRQEQKEAGQEDKARALAAAIPATALERVGMGKALNVIHGVVPHAASTVLKEAGKGVLKEGATEGAQNVIEQIGAFKDPTTSENLQDTALSAVMGGIGGGVAGGAGGVVDGMRQRAHQRTEAEAAQREQAAQVAVEEANAFERAQAGQAAGDAATVRADVLAADEGASPVPDDGGAGLREQQAVAQRLREQAQEASRSVSSPDDEIYQSTGADVSRSSAGRASSPSQQMGIDPTAGPLSRVAALAVDTGAAQEAQFIAATGRDLQVRTSGPGVANDANVIDVQGRVLEDPAIGTPRRLTTDQQMQEAFDAQAATPALAGPAPALPAPGAAAVEAAGDSNSNATPGVTLEPQADQAQQAAAQPAQAGAAQAAGPAPGGADAPAAAGAPAQGALSHGAPTQDNGAQAATAPAQAGQAPAVTQSVAQRPGNWRTSMLGAKPVAAGLGIDTKGKRLAQVVAEIDAADGLRGATASAAATQGAEVSRDAGRYKEGMSEFRANQVRAELARKNPGVIYTVEEDAALKNGYVVVGRQPGPGQKLGAERLRASKRRAAPEAPRFSLGPRKPQDFVPNVDGGLDYGEITPEMGKAMRRQAGIIRLQEGVQNPDGSGYGLAHIEARHGAQIRSLGYDRIQDFVSDSVRGFDQIWQAGNTIQIVASRSGSRGRVVFLQLEIEKSGDYYRVNSAFPVDAGYLAKKERREGWKSLWSRYPVPADASGASGFADQSPNAGETAPMVEPRGDASSVPPEDKSAKFSKAMTPELAAAIMKEQPARGDDRSAARKASDARLVATQQLVDGLSEKWANKPEIIVARNMEDEQIPKHVRDYDAKLKSQGATGEPQGFILGGKVYLLSDALDGPNHIATVLFHEVLGHYGLRRVFGDGLKPILHQVALARRADVQAKAREYGLDWNNVDDRLVAAEEVLAEMAQTNPQLGWVQKAVSAIRNWLREHLPGFKSLAMTNNDIIEAFILPARGAVARQNETMEQALERSMAAFSRSDGSPFSAEVRTAVAAGLANDEAALRAQVPIGIETPPALQLLGVARKPVVTNRDLIAKMHFEHGVPRADLERLGELVSNPVMVFKSDTRPGRLVVVTNLVVRGSPVVVAVDPNGASNRAEVVYVPSAYPKDNADRSFTRWIRDGLLQYANKQESRQLATTARLQLPGVVQRAIGFHVDYKTEADLPQSPDKLVPRFSRGATVGTDGYTSAQAPAFSRATTLEHIDKTIRGVTVTNLKQQAGFKAADYRGIGLQFLGRRQLVDVYGGMLPELRAYSDLMARMDADKNEAGAGADQLAREWAKLPDERALAELMHDSTLAQIDPSKDFVDGDNKTDWTRLRAKYQALTPEAKDVYTRARDTYRQHMRDVRSAIKERIERAEMSSERRAAMLKRMDDEFFGHIKGVYFPLARFGQYVVVVKDSEGKTVNVSRAETMAEAYATRQQLLAPYPASKGFTVGKVLKSKDFVAERDSVGRGFMEQLYGVLDKQGMDGKQRAELEDALGQLYLSSLPDLSWAKHGIHRKGTPGFSQDARRAFAQNVFHGASYLAKLRYADQLQDQLAGMQRRVDAGSTNSGFDSVKGQQVVDEMVKRHDAAMNPKTNAVSTALTSLGFMFHLGLSPASAMVNLTQTALVAYPVMAGRWGFQKAGAALLKASQEAVRGKNDITASLNADEKAAYEEAVRSGVVDVTMAHDLAGIAQGEDRNVSHKLAPVMRAASFLFHHAEKFNRQVTFIAAYRLARETGSDQKTAYQQAVQATYDGHFDYSANNRPRVMQGNVARVLLLFKQYGQNMVYTLVRNAQQSLKGATPEARAEARKALGGLLAMHGMAAGVLGLPMVTTLLAAASMLGGDDDEPWDAQVALQNMLADTFGQKPAEVLAHGFSRLTPWDISGRVGLDKLIFPDVQEGLEGQRLAESAMTAALGPVAGIGINVLKGVQEMSEGRYQRGLETMAPSVLRGPLKALRYGEEGARDKTGIVVQDEVDAAALLGQAIGFSPASVRNAYEGKSAIVGQDRALQARRSALVEQFAMAAMAKDEEGKAEAREDIAQFNEKNPSRRIQPMQLLQSVHMREKRIREAKEGVYLPAKRRDAIDAGRFAVDG